MKYLILCLFLVGCSKYTGPYRECVKGHNYTYMQYDPSLKLTVTKTGYKCDQYSKQEYIKVDKTVYEVQKIYETNAK